ncbi:MAG: GNAT family N-acetyltransferase [Proteobacteria bacterium]|nr:GNAT family N-acetyltransferase [Pseudomonadota bacterium]
MGLKFPGEQPRLADDVSFELLKEEHIPLAVEAIKTFRINMREAITAGRSTKSARTPQISLPYTAETMARQLSKGTLKGLVAMHEGEMVGLITYSLIADPSAPKPDLIFVSTLWVHGGKRRNSIAQVLIGQACVKEGRPAMLFCDQHNQPAQGFYSRIHGKTLPSARLIIYEP